MIQLVEVTKKFGDTMAVQGVSLTVKTAQQYNLKF
jgi:ABC-type uncharacterized transport system ATPase subunit